MARITSQEAAQKFGGLFDLVLGASHRAREILSGSAPRIKSKNGALVTAVKEIEEGKYTRQEWNESFKKRGKYNEHHSAKSKRYSK
jgi:DNA-directed RNA polymerase subunit omega